MDQTDLKRKLRNYLLRKIPEIFVPQNWFFMPKIPCNNNGKPDMTFLKDYIDWYKQSSKVPGLFHFKDNIQFNFTGLFNILKNVYNKSLSLFGSLNSFIFRKKF